jgi:spermidine synthase
MRASVRSTPGARGDASFPLLLACFFLSGVAGLVYETAWTHEFAFVFGTSELAVATVLAAYMGGLAAGAALAGRFAHRVRRPILAYGLLELGIGLGALAVPAAIAASRWLYVALYGTSAALPAGDGLTTSLFYLATSFLILLIPTSMMGMTLPLLVGYAVDRDADIARRTGLLYAANTGGAVTGTLLAALVLLPAVGLRHTIWTAVALNGLVFAAAVALARTSGASPEPRADGPPAADGRRVHWILPLILVSGAVSFAYEVLWVRLLAHLLGSSVVAFATMLASFLSGIALGSVFAARRATGRERAARGFAIAQLVIAVASYAAFRALPEIDQLAAYIAAQTGLDQLADVLVAALTLVPATLAIGATFPLAVRALARGSADASRATARVYAANTLGSIAGSVGAGFFLVPTLGYAGTLAACAATNLVLAGAAVLCGARPRGLAVASAAGLALLVAIPPEPPWRILRTSALSGELDSSPLEFFAVGRSATVLMLASNGRWFLRTNGLPEANINSPGMSRIPQQVAHLLTTLPVLARPSARSLFLVGFGGGVALEVVPGAIEHVDVVELEPEVLAANRSIGARRWRDPLADPRVHVHVNDARNAMLLTKRRFDAIVSQPSHPWSSGASHLYTREFFELAKGRLEPEGVLVQWIGLGFVDEFLFRSLLATLTAVFENVQVYMPRPMSGALFLASDAPIDIARGAARAIEAAGDEFATLGIRVPEDIAMHLRVDAEGARELSRGAPVNSDDHNLLQSGSGQLGERSVLGEMGALLKPFEPLATATPDLLDVFYLLPRLPAQRAARVLETLPASADRTLAEALLALEAGEAAAEETLRAMADHPQARGALLRGARQEIEAGRDPEELLGSPLDPLERAVVTGWRVQADVDALRELEPVLRAIPPRHPLAAQAARLRAEWRIESGDPQRAWEAIEIVDGSLWSLWADGDLLLRARASLAAEEPLAALDMLGALARRVEGRDAQTRTLLRRGLRLARSVPAQPESTDLQRRVERALRAQIR